MKAQEQTERKRRNRKKSIKRDILPEYVQRQISGGVCPAVELTEEQRQEAARLLAALGEG